LGINNTYQSYYSIVVNLIKNKREKMLEDPFDICKYCGGEVDTHSIDCPHLTNVYPVIGGTGEEDITCELCSVELLEGSVYTILSQDSELAVSCLGCAAIESAMERF
jgi:hypothetical protein